MSKGSNSRKNRFLNAFVKFSLEDVQSDITCRCKFNFSYFDTNQEYGADLATWDEKNLQQFYSKLKSYSAHPLSYWQQQNVGSHRNHVLEIYGGFPKRSGFVHPSHVPSDVDSQTEREERNQPDGSSPERVPGKQGEIPRPLGRRRRLSILGPGLALGY